MEIENIGIYDPIASSNRVSDARDVNEFIDDIDVELNARCKILKLKAKELCDSLKSAFLIEMVKLPKKVKGMKMKEFLESSSSSQLLSSIGGSIQPMHGAASTVVRPHNHIAYIKKDVSDKGSLLDSIRKQARDKRNALRQLIATGTSNPTNNDMASAFSHHKTPMHTPHRSYTAASACKTPIVRDPRLGEQIISENGSPLGVYSAVKAKMRPNIAQTPTISIALPGSDTEFIDISNPNTLDQIDEKNKDIALRELEILQQTVQQLISKIKN